MRKTKATSVTIDIADLPMFKGYVVIFAFRWFWYSYYRHMLIGYKNMQFGNILFILFIMPFTTFVDVWKLTGDYILEVLDKPFQVYRLLSGQDK